MPVPCGATRLKPTPVVDDEMVVVLFTVAEEDVPETVDDEDDTDVVEESVELLLPDCVEEP